MHTPLIPATRGLIAAAQLALMKPTAFLLNTARGAVVDEAALVDALRTKSIAGAGLDVYEVEPVQKDNPLFQFDNVVLLPHMAAHTDQALRRMAMVAADILAVLEGREPQFRVA